ncbi:ABC-type bacteriocin/lantibiotic exporter, contains an N-terminal double-glycine peptidase domain [Bizionia echini]|uniref:ABC-type bacteriocin/lantibiotic exporter, contains an N-terminal double-glycine peptidase domain n=1 Tax=Bizionia echini TaxID=649333 RepID=A0A1I5AUX4_9FLAO|nr:ATP-binding cassette domain-containing protein [Bizionia echini]SFN66009.1 ABC-type bacteriocin/lantibiotic exporter, contains an N-terminal double-glycine peptidase domain [Bizionia echini]
MPVPKMSPLQRFVGLLKLERKDILQIVYYAVFSGIVALSLPLGIQAIINLLLGAQVSTSWIVLVILVTVGIIFSGALRLMQLRIIETIQQRIFTRSSFEMTYRFPKITMDELRNYYPPELANRFFDTITIQKGLTKILIDIPAAVLQIAFSLILLSFYHPFFIIFGVFLFVLVYVVLKYTAVRGLETSIQESKMKYMVVHWIQEIARTVVSFKLSGKTNLAITKNDELVVRYLKARESHFRILMIQFIQMITFKVVVTAGLLTIGGALVLNQEMNIGQFVAAEIIIILVIASVEKLILGLETFYDVLTSFEKLGEVVDKTIESQEGEKSNLSDSLTIDFERVCYRVEDRDLPILNNISFRITPKCRILITGKSGSGKSSLLRLISGVIQPTSGNIIVNNMSLESINLNYYRSQIGISLSEETPFIGTIRENITFGNPNITDEEVYKALDNVGLTEFIREQKSGLQTILHPEGRTMAHTTSKKIILARAIVTKPKLLILEDPLDLVEDLEADKIIEFLARTDNPWSLVIVARNHNWKTYCNQIISLDGGELKSNTQ